MTSSFDLTAIPIQNVIKIAQKLASPSELVRLQQTNSGISKICHSSEPLMPLELHLISYKFNANPEDLFVEPRKNWYQKPLRFNELQNTLKLFKIKCEKFNCETVYNPELHKYLVELIKEYKISVSSLNLHMGNSCSPEEIRSIIQISSASSFTMRRSFIDRDKFPTSLFNSITNKLSMEINYNDEDLFQLNAKHIGLSNSNVTYSGINRLLKAWKRNEIELDGFAFAFTQPNIIEEAIAGTNATVLYTPDWHQYSFIYDDGAFDSPEDSENEKDDNENSSGEDAVVSRAVQSVIPLHFYIYWKPEDIYNKYCLNIEEKSAIFDRCPDPTEELEEYRYMFQIPH